MDQKGTLMFHKRSARVGEFKGKNLGYGGSHEITPEDERAYKMISWWQGGGKNANFNAIFEVLPQTFQYQVKVFE